MKRKMSVGEQEQDLRITMDNLRMFKTPDTRNELLSEIVGIVKPCFDIGLGSRLNELKRLYKEIFSMTYAEMDDQVFNLAEECERVLHAFIDEGRPHEVEERFEKDVLATLTLDQKEDKPAMRLLFTIWLDELVRSGEVSEEIASECGQPLECRSYSFY